MTTALTTNEKINRLLARLPQAGPFNERAAELLAQYRRCTLQALQQYGPGSLRAEREAVVDEYRVALLGALGDVAADAALARVREGGAV